MKKSIKIKFYFILYLTLFLLFFVKLTFSQTNLQKINLTEDTNVQGFTLLDCYQRALMKDENIAIKKQAVEEARANSLSAWSTLFPHVTFAYTYYRQGPYPIQNTASYISQQASQQGRFTLVQDIFEGFKEYAGLAAVKAEYNQRVAEELFAEQSLMEEVATSYYQIITEQKAIQIYREIDKTLSQEINVLQERVSVGRSRPSDLSSTKVLLYQNEAQIESVKSVEVDSIEQLKFLTGLEKIDSLSDIEGIPYVLKDESTYINKASLRPDVQATKEAYDVAQEQVTIARGNFWPSISLIGDYYPENTGKFTSASWDLSVALQLPLLPTIDNIGNLNLSRARAIEAQKNYELAQRTAIYQIQTAYENLRTAFIQLVAYEKALKANEENYKYQKDDYNLHLINTIEFLQIVQSLQTSRLAYMNILYQTKQLYWNFKVAIGEL